MRIDLRRLRRALPRLDSSGVTLVELMIGFVIVSVGILALSGVQTRCFTDVHNTGRRTRALAVAETQMEQERRLGFAGVVPANGVSGEFVWQSVVDTLAVDLHRVTVRVTWTEKRQARAVELVTLLSDR